MKRFWGVVLISGTLLAPAAYSDKDPQTGRVYYRYMNEQGIMVLNSSIPPNYVRKGYEVVSMQGEVLRVVPPAPDEADAERIAEERRIQVEQQRNDALLRRRYASLNDLDVDKRRSLMELENSINILQNNLANIRIQIEQQQSQAAIVERSGREVTPEILRHITSLQAEHQDVEEQIAQRRKEYDSLGERFDQDRARLAELLTPKDPARH